MSLKSVRRGTWTLLAISVALASGRVARAQAANGGTLEESAAPGANYDKAQFRLWMPKGVTTVKAVVVLVPGSNGDGRGEALDSVWQAFATRHQVALMGCMFTDKKHDQSFIEEYVDVAHGSGQALLDALTAFAADFKHPELAGAPLLLWGMSAGGEFNYEFVAWKPERVAAFVVNKGGIYYSALLPRAARSVPGMLFVGGADLDSRTSTIKGLFAVNRRGGALWALAEEPGAKHIVGRSKDVAMVFFEDVLALRLAGATVAATGQTTLTPIGEQTGFLADLKANTFRAMTGGSAPTESTAWLPTERVARAWEAMVTGKPFDP